jgi:effector-binding domain-containing protein
MPYEIELKELPDRYVVTARTTTTPDNIGEAFQELLPEVDAEILNAGVRPTGPPFAIYHVYQQDTVDMELGFPVDEPVPTTGRVIGRELEASPAAVTFHHGPYESLGQAYRAVEAWMRENGREASGPPWEVYWTGPMDGEGSANWKTEVGYPIKGE